MMWIKQSRSGHHIRPMGCQFATSAFREALSSYRIDVCFFKLKKKKYTSSHKDVFCAKRPKRNKEYTQKKKKSIQVRNISFGN